MPDKTLSSILVVLLAMPLFAGESASGQKSRSASAAKSKPAVIHPTSSTGQDDGYRGIWYMNQPQKDPYKYKYSGGLGTYPANHIPFACYSEKANKTFFCYGGTRKDKQQLLEMVSYYDHATDRVPRPTILMDKKTEDAHDNPVISLDDEGYVWVFASSHGTSRPSYVFKSERPYSTDSFKVVRVSNFSYPEVWYMPGSGFFFLHTLYKNGRGLNWSTSRDGIEWTTPHLLAHVDQGHYQVGWPFRGKVGTAFNYHPKVGGLNARTNLYYVETPDGGKSWRTVRGAKVQTPLTQVHNEALVRDYQVEKLLVYIVDLNFDAEGRPIILYVTSRGHESGPKNDPRTWTIAHWMGIDWVFRPVTTSDSNYDAGCLHVESDGTWRIIGPTEQGPQAYNPGGEMVCWTSVDQGRTWKKERQITQRSELNHTYARRPVNAHPDFYAFWADGNARQPSESRLYFCDRSGRRVRRLPPVMDGPFARPIAVE